MDVNRFKHIRTLQDIKLEKARLRYEMLLAENSLMDRLGVVQDFFTASALLSKASEIFSRVRSIYDSFRNVMGWFFRKKQEDL